MIPAGGNLILGAVVVLFFVAVKVALLLAVIDFAVHHWRRTSR